MRVMIDSNIAIDVFTKRQGYYEKSLIAYTEIMGKQYEPMISANSVTDIYYIVNRLNDRDTAIYVIKELFEDLIVLDTTSTNIGDALDSGGADFEDDVLASVAKRNSVDYIIMRNPRDFRHSSVDALQPEEFLEKIGRGSLRLNEETLDIYSV